MKLDQFIDRHRVTMTAEPAPRNPQAENDEWAQNARHFKCRLRCGARSMTAYFSQGSAHTADPTAADVLDCLASDAAGYANAQDFADWCSEYGYDEDSRRAERIHKAVAKQAASLRRLLGGQDYETMLWDVERN